MVIGLLEARLSLPEAHSLKDKRRILKSLRDRITVHMNVSVAEVGAQDLWKSAELAFVTVAAGGTVVDQRLAKIREKLQSDPRYVLLDVHTEEL